MPSLCFPAELIQLAEIRRFVQDTVTSLGSDCEMTLDLVQAVDEAATNVIVHGYRGCSGQIEVDVERHDNLIVIFLRDQAPPFDPTLFPSPDLDVPLEKRQVGGLGIFLIRQSVDEFHHRTLPTGGNELMLIKHT